MKEYVLSLTAAAIMAGILLSFCSDGPGKRVLKLVSGILLAITALQPLVDWKLPDFSEEYSAYQAMGRELASQGADMAEDVRQGYISHALEAYILDKAESLGLALSVTVELQEDGSPDSVLLTGSWTESTKAALETIITNDLGIPGEAQTWITKREEDGLPTSSENTGGQQQLP